MRRAPALVALLACALGTGGAARAGEPPLAARAPIVVVDTGREVEREEVDAVVQGLGAPVLRGAELARALRAESPLLDETQEIAARFAATQDAFFAGDHAAARQAFESLVARIEGDPCALVLQPELRRIGFESRLYLAIVARGDADEAAVGDLLAGAARIYRGLEPAPAEFPPWVCEAHARVAAGATGPDVDRRCALPLEGGRVIAAVDGGDLRVAAGEGATEAELLADLAALARAGGWSRIVVAVGRTDGLEVMVVDAEVPPHAPASEPPADRPWYRNGLAWAVTGAGLALAGTGFALGRVYGTPSAEEPAAWALMAAGAGVAGTGLVLFLLPAPDGTDAEGQAVAVGLCGSIRF